MGEVERDRALKKLSGRRCAVIPCGRRGFRSRNFPAPGVRYQTGAGQGRGITRWLCLCHMYRSCFWRWSVYGIRDGVGGQCGFCSSAIYLAAVHTVFMGSIRYRLPAMPCLIILAGIGADYLLSRYRRNRTGTQE